MQIMRDHVQHVEFAFTMQTMAIATAIAVFDEISTMGMDGELSIPDMRDLLQNLMFVRQPNDQKEKWKTSEEERVSTRRRRIKLSNISMARKNMFRQFDSKKTPDSSKPKMQRWLTKRDKVMVKDDKTKV